MSEKIKNDYKEKIYQAAQRLFYEKGYTNTSVAEIIELSGTNKGSFYHYYSKKEDLAKAVLLNSHYQHTELRNLFPKETSLVRLALENRVFWHVFVHQESFRRFIADLNRESLHYESDYMTDPCKEYSPRKFSYKEYALIECASIGLRRNLAIFMYDNYDKYEFYEPSNFYLTNFFKLFEISKEDIDYTLKRSMELFYTLEITTEGFDFYAEKKK